MKLSQFRNATIRRRLNEAAEGWKKANPKKSFEKSESPSISARSQPVLLFLLMLLPLMMLYLSSDDGVLLALVLPVIAACVSLNHTQMTWLYLTNRPLYHLPVGDLELKRQIVRSSRGVFLKGFFWAFLYGTFAAGHGTSLGWGASSALIYLGLVAFLTLSALPGLKKLSFFTLSVFGAASFTYLISEWFQKIMADIVPHAPWHLALFSFPTLAAFLGSGIFIAWMMRKKWVGVSPWDRTLFYQIYGASGQNAESIAVDYASLEIPDKASYPTGLLERLMWKFLSPKERAILRTVGGTHSNFLHAWIFASLCVAGLAWLVSLDLFPKWSSFNFCLTTSFFIFYTITSSILFRIHWIHRCFAGAISTSPQSQAAIFHLFPLGLSVLEKLLWKEGAFRWPLIAFTISLGITLFSKSSSWNSLFPTFLCLLPLVVLVNNMMFWAARLRDWSESFKAGGPRILLTFVSIFILALMIISLVSQVLFQDLTFEMPSVSSLLLGCYLTSIIGILIPRYLVRGYVANPRRDLMKQV